MPSAVVATSTLRSFARRRSSSRSRSSAGGTGVRRGVDVVGAQPVGDDLGVAHGEAVDDAGAGQAWDVLASQASRSVWRGRCSTPSAKPVAPERPAERRERGAELVGDVAHDPVVGRRGAAEHRHRAGPKRGDEAADAPVVGPEVVTPVGDAVHLVDHDQTGPLAEQRHDRGAELGIGQPLG